MYTKMYKLFSLLLLIALLITACGGGGNGNGEEGAPPGEKEESPSRSSGSSVTANGFLVPAKTAELSFGANGQVAEILVQKGTQVNAEDVLVRLTGDDQAQADIADAEYNLAVAQQEYDTVTVDHDVALTDAKDEYAEARQTEEDARKQVSYTAEKSTTFQKEQAALEHEVAVERLAKKQEKYDLIQQGPDPKELAKAEANLKAAQAKLDSTKAAVELRAPFGGTVVELNLVVGGQVTAGETVVKMADLSKWYVDTDDLTEIEVVKVSEGQAVSIVPDALSDVRMSGMITSISGAFEEKRGDVTYTARIEVAEVDPRLRWGMTVEVNFSQ